MRIIASFLVVLACAARGAAAPDTAPSPTLEANELIYDAGQGLAWRHRSPTRSS